MGCKFLERVRGKLAPMTITSDTFGRDCCAVNFIIAMNKMRFKQGKGDPSGFKQFLRQNNIKPSIIIWYVVIVVM